MKHENGKCKISYIKTRNKGQKALAGGYCVTHGVEVCTCGLEWGDHKRAYSVLPKTPIVLLPNEA